MPTTRFDFGIYTGVSGTIVRSEPFRGSLSGTGSTNNSTPTKKEETTNTAGPKIGCNMAGEARSRGVQNLPCPKYL